MTFQFFINAAVLCSLKLLNARGTAAASQPCLCSLTIPVAPIPAEKCLCVSLNAFSQCNAIAELLFESYNTRFDA